jgi:hypothetical protein
MGDIKTKSGITGFQSKYCSNLGIYFFCVKKAIKVKQAVEAHRVVRRRGSHIF